MANKLTISDQLRQAIERSGISRYKISQSTGIAESVLSRFVRGETGLTLDTVDTLCELLNARLVVESDTRRKRRQ